MRRGEIWTVAAGGGYVGKPRPAVIVQADDFADLPSLAVCGLTTDPTPAPLLRIEVMPSESNGLHSPCRIMVDKVLTGPKAKVGFRIGALDEGDLIRLNQALIVFLGIAISPRSQRRSVRAAVTPKRA
ncbi:type II toxin-antitoxin system PemK/MazF family toxin [Methylopila sp. M107]|uniref:type II toxin-antitoxin system PemK/MazF family toxin n=1 Tax=Methylopila sp. M107 TaxID=1101190 RepID=UPI000366578B|nr:type II toxin-antitoxin system PemK/MazF family toxin [Methylopila sp. M107]